MKSNFFAVLSVSLLSLSAASFQVQACEGEAHAAQSANSQEPSLTLTESGPQKAVFEVHGVMCRSCEKKLKAALNQVQGVKSVTFLKAGSKSGTRIAQVTFANNSKVSPAALTHAVEDAGFKATITQ